MIFKKRETIVGNLTFLGIMSALNLVLMTICEFIPFVSIIGFIILPLASTIAFLFCKIRYFPIYVVATIALSFLITFDSFETTLFTLIPNLVTGVAFGALIRLQLPRAFILIIPSIINLALTYFMNMIADAIFDANLLQDVFPKILGIDSSPYASMVVLTLFYMVSLASCSFIYLIMREELPKFNTFQTNTSYPYFLPGVLSIFFFGLSVLFAFVYPLFTYVSFILGAYFTILLIVDMALWENKLYLIGLGVALLVYIFANALIYAYVPTPFTPILMMIFFILTCFYINFCYYLRIWQKKHKI
jgi:hypothetical protein